MKKAIPGTATTFSRSTYGKFEYLTLDSTTNTSFRLDGSGTSYQYVMLTVHRANTVTKTVSTLYNTSFNLGTARVIVGVLKSSSTTVELIYNTGYFQTVTFTNDYSQASLGTYTQIEAGLSSLSSVRIASKNENKALIGIPSITNNRLLTFTGPGTFTFGPGVGGDPYEQVRVLENDKLLTWSNTGSSYILRNSDYSIISSGSFPVTIGSVANLRGYSNLLCQASTSTSYFSMTIDSSNIVSFSSSVLEQNYYSYPMFITPTFAITIGSSGSSSYCMSWELGTGTLQKGSMSGPGAIFGSDNSNYGCITTDSNYFFASFGSTNKTLIFNIGNTYLSPANKLCYIGPIAEGINRLTFTYTRTVPANTSASYWYSLDNGATWIEYTSASGTEITIPLSYNILGKIIMSTTDPSVCVTHTAFTISGKKV